MIQWIRDRMQRSGQSMVEFALILVLVACVAMVTITVAGNELSKTFTDIQEAVTNPGDAGATSADLAVTSAADLPPLRELLLTDEPVVTDRAGTRRANS